jgi:polyisoprenoid-binding protein YceI
MSLRLLPTAAFGAWLSFLSVCLAAEAVPAPGGAAVLTPQNTQVQFVCAHVGPKPDPRKGGFAKVSGKAAVEGQALKAVTLEIDTTSLHTEFDKLTTHLKSPDFFETRRFPTAKFESTKIETANGMHQISGKLTLHGVTKEITIPAKVEVTESGLKLASEFTLNRLDYGINYDPKKVESNVSMTVVIGEKL